MGVQEKEELRGRCEKGEEKGGTGKSRGMMLLIVIAEVGRQRGNELVDPRSLGVWVRGGAFGKKCQEKSFRSTEMCAGEEHKKGAP